MSQDVTQASPAGDAELTRLRRDAGSGSPEMMFRLAAALVARGEVDEAAGLYQRAAAAGHSGAQVEVARMLLFGVGADPDPRMAVEWLLRAEALGNPIAGYFLALVGLGGVVLPRDGRINERMLVAVQHDYPPAVRAAAIHLGRKDNPEDQATCLKLLDRAAGRGDAVAARLLAERLARGEGCAMDVSAASALRARLSQAGHPPLPAVSAALPAPVLPLRESGEVPPGTLAFEEALQPAPTEVLATRPRVLRIDRLLSADECRLLIASAQPHLRRSTAVDPQTGAAFAKEIRTSSDCSFDPLMEDFALRTVQLRMARAARVELAQAERLIVLSYQPGEEYRPHRDYLPAGVIERDGPEAGNRSRTICVYLNDVEAGGESEFPVAGISVSPQAGRAVVFDNLADDGMPDPNSLHAGLQVQRGEKWLATLWLRQRRYRAF